MLTDAYVDSCYTLISPLWGHTRAHWKRSIWTIRRTKSCASVVSLILRPTDSTYLGALVLNPAVNLWRPDNCWLLVDVLFCCYGCYDCKWQFRLFWCISVCLLVWFRRLTKFVVVIRYPRTSCGTYARRCCGSNTPLFHTTTNCKTLHTPLTADHLHIDYVWIYFMVMYMCDIVTLWQWSDQWSSDSVISDKW